MAIKNKKDELEWTSLRGSNRKKLVKRLPPKILEIFNDHERTIGCHLTPKTPLYSL